MRERDDSGYRSSCYGRVSRRCMHTHTVGDIATCRRVDIVDYTLRHRPFIDHRELYKERRDNVRARARAPSYVCSLCVGLFLI